MTDRPVKPAVSGRFHLPGLDAWYTAGLVLARPHHTLACDIETYGLDADARRIKCVTFSTRVEAVVLDPRDPAQADAIRETIARTTRIVMHNSSFDVPNLYLAGLWDLDWCAKVTDTLLYARLAHPDTLERKSLEALADRHLGMIQGEPITKAFKRLGLTRTAGYHRLDIDSPMYLHGAVTDAIVTARLLRPIRQAALDTTTKGHPFSTYGVTGEEAERLVDREQVINRGRLRRACQGLRVDMDYLDQYREVNNRRRHAAEADLVSHDVRPGNAGDLIRALEAVDAVPLGWPTTPTGRPSTAAGHLETLTHPLAAQYLAAKRIAKVEDDYLAKVTELAVNGRIHPVLNLLAATTGRASMGSPPLHQFPADARGIILADPGDTLVSIDWSQIEPVLAANIAGDTAVLDGYEHGTSDLYTDVATAAGVSRKQAKVVLLAQLYGEGMRKLAADLGIGIEVAEDLRGQIWRAMPATSRLVSRLREIGRVHRKVFTLSGRILTVPMGRGFDGGPPSVATHKAVNYTMQGGAYDILAEALVRIDAAGLGDAVYLTMHDEIIVSQSAARDVEAIMQTPPDRLCFLAGRTPVLRTDYAVLGERWADA